MMAKPQPEFDRAELRTALSKLLQSSNIDPDCTAHLDEHFVGLLAEKRLLTVCASPLPDSLKSGAQELDELSSKLALRLHVDFEEERAVYSPLLFELLSDAFDTCVVGRRDVTSIDRSDGEHRCLEAIRGWHPGQWGVWCQRLSADLALLKRLTTVVQGRLSEASTAPPVAPAMTDEDLVLRIHAAVSRCLPEGDKAKKQDVLIAEIMCAYDLADSPEGISMDKIRGILRKHKKIGVSR